MCGGLELLLWMLLYALYKRERDVANSSSSVWLSLWALSPLPAIEIWLNGHLDVLGLLLLAGTLVLLRRLFASQKAPGWLAFAMGASLSLGALVKPLGVFLLPGIYEKARQVPTPKARRWLISMMGTGAVCAALLAWAPYRQAGLKVLGSLGEYGRRWRSNDGAYAVLQAVTEKIVAFLYKPPFFEPWKQEALARLVTGRDRATVWPDELSSFLARAVVAVALLVLLRFAVKARLSPSRCGLLLLSGYALLTPTLHPWYLLWPLILAPLWIEAALPVLLLSMLTPLAYLPLRAEWAGQGHHESTLVRAVEHVPAWLAVAQFLLRDAARRRKVLSGAPHSG